MAYWLIRSEPSAYAWDDLVDEGRDRASGGRTFSCQHKRLCR